MRLRSIAAQHDPKALTFGEGHRDGKRELCELRRGALGIVLASRLDDIDQGGPRHRGLAAATVLGRPRGHPG